MRSRKTAVLISQLPFNRICQVAPTAQERATVTLGRVPSSQQWLLVVCSGGAIGSALYTNSDQESSQVHYYAAVPLRPHMASHSISRVSVQRAVYIGTGQRSDTLQQAWQKETAEILMVL